MDFNAAAPSLAPLEHSGAQNKVEDQLRLLTLDLWHSLLAERSADIGVLGAPHLGSFDLVRRELNADGLLLLKSDNEEGMTRYLYKAFRSRKKAGRGLHFLKTYLQILFPNDWEVEPVWCSAADYPESTISADYWTPYLDDPDLSLDGSWYLDEPVAWRQSSSLADRPGQFLTSRVIIYLSYADVDAEDAQRMLAILRSVVPVKITPELKFWVRSQASMFSSITSSLEESLVPDTALLLNGEPLLVNGEFVMATPIPK